MEPLLSCPISRSDNPAVSMAHGGGGRIMHELIESIFLPAFENPLLASRHDGAVMEIGNQRLAFTTDSYVIRPLVFPGGDIGSLAVYGTVNDLAMCGAVPRWLSAGFIIEEGLPINTLKEIVQSMRHAAASAGVQLVTGDTKVVDKGKGDGLFINTAGIGILNHSLPIGPASVKPGDAVLLSGDVGRHGISIMSVREGLEFENPVESDCGPLSQVVIGLIESGIHPHCLRDLTRGGLASALNEIAESACLQIDIDESAIPVSSAVQGACEILGLDPLSVANEGRFIAFVPPGEAARALEIMHRDSMGVDARIIGTVSADTPGLVTLKSWIGVSRVLDMLSGEQLPRIC